MSTTTTLESVTIGSTSAQVGSIGSTSAQDTTSIGASTASLLLPPAIPAPQNPPIPAEIILETRSSGESTSTFSRATNGHNIDPNIPESYATATTGTGLNLRLQHLERNIQNTQRNIQIMEGNIQRILVELQNRRNCCCVIC